MSSGDLARAHVRLRLGVLTRGLCQVVARRSALTAELAQPEVAHLAITEQHARVLLDRTMRFIEQGPRVDGGAIPSAAEEADDRAIRASARAAAITLPCDALAARDLSPLEFDALLLIAAPDLEPAYGGLYAFVHDAVQARRATPELCAAVLASDEATWTTVVEATGPFGTLRREGLVDAHKGERPLAVPLTVAPGVLELLSGSGVDAGLLGTRARPLVGTPMLPATVDVTAVARLADALTQRRLEVVGIWGEASTGREEVAAAVAGSLDHVRASNSADLMAALQAAAMAEAICIVDVPDDEDARDVVAELVGASTARVLLLGDRPLRSNELVTSRDYAELRIDAGRFREHRHAWATAFPDLEANQLDDLAARFRLGPGDVEAVAALDRSARAWSPNGHRPGLDALAGMVTRRRSPKLAAIRPPQRGLDMLVLPPSEHAQILEIAAAFRAWPRVAQRWNLERFGNPGVIALLTGDPGTGKTLAAEVIAHEVGLDLMTVDLARVVSKWIGETEQNLDAVFGEAQLANCVLFFDEADALFGQRGEVTRGSDRYANLEVGYLLQRLERHEGLVVLASNMRGNLDPAFTRRFHHVVHFPRPEAGQRRQLWDRALAPPVQLAEPVDLDVLAGLELTGAGVAAIVRSSALLAHAEGRSALGIRDLVGGIARQFQREARVLPRGALGPYADVLG